MSISNNVYEKFRKIIVEQNKKIRQQEEKIRQLKQREEEKIRRTKQKERERLQRLKEKEQEKREKAMEQVRKKKLRKFQQMRKKEEDMRKREEKKRRREIKKEYERKERFRIAKKKLGSKLKKIEKSGRNLRPILVSEAIRRNTSKWMIPGGGFKDPLVVLESTTPAVQRLINSIDSVGKKAHTVLVCKMVRTGPETGKNTFTIAHFSSKTHSMISEEDVKNEYLTMKEKMLESLAKYIKLGSGWRLQSVEMLEIFITKFNRDSERVTKILKTQAEKYNWNDIGFPTKLKDKFDHKFEKNNNVNVNVFSYDGGTKKVYTLRLSKTEHEETINLFLYNEHYGVVKT